MKKMFTAILALILLVSSVMPISAAGPVYTANPEMMQQALYVMLGILVLLLLGCMISLFAFLRSKANRRSYGIILTMTVLAAVITVLIFLFCMKVYQGALDQPETLPPKPSTEETTLPPETTTVPETTAPVETTEETTVPPTTQAPDPLLSFAPAKTESSDPANWNVKWEIMAEKKIVDSFTRDESISFGEGSEYFALPGIATFRGNNFRNCSTYGTANVTNEDVSVVWSKALGSFNGWSGSGWTGQPLIVQWDEETKQIMNLYESKKNKEGLVEIIYATLDGHIYFYDLEDGSYTRDPINMGMNFKGAGALDPRGYPLLYVGSGIYTDTKAPRMFVVSLIDGKILYQHGNGDKFQKRNWSAFDASPLVDAETDTLIWPGENGLLYTIKLNTSYDKAAGTISVEPDNPVKTRYTSKYSKAGRYYGYETSPTVVGNYLYAAENGGMLYCVDLNTMDLIWAQDTGDDNNSSPAFEWGADGQGYVYSAPSLHYTAKSGGGTISIHKINAQTGEIVWERPYDCTTIKDLSGGVQSTPLLGKEGTDIQNMVIYSIARVPSNYKGVLVAFDRETGETIWEISTGNYAWSSPTAVYTEEGKAYIFICDASGNAKLVEGATGKVVDTVSFGSTVEASPIVFKDRIIIGSRGGKVYCLKIS